MKTEFVRDQMEALNKQLDEMAKNAFVIGPTVIQQCPPLHKIVLSTVKIDPDSKGDCYIPEGGTVDSAAPDAKVLCLGFQAMLKIAQAAGVEWVTNKCGRIDDGKNPNVTVYRAVCRWRDSSGQERETSAEYVLDIDVRYDLAMLKGDEAKANKEALKLKQSALQRAESGAKSRAIRAALAIRSGGYSKAELRAKPFIVPRLVVDIDYANDPMARQMLTAKALGLTSLPFWGRGPNAGPDGWDTANLRELPRPQNGQAPALPAALPGDVAPSVAPINLDDARISPPDEEPIDVDHEPQEKQPPLAAHLEFDSEDDDSAEDAPRAPAVPGEFPSLEQFIANLGDGSDPERRKVAVDLVINLLHTREYTPPAGRTLEGSIEGVKGMRKAESIVRWYEALVVAPLKAQG